MTARWLAFVIWAVAAASAVFWGLRLLVTAPAAPAHALALDVDGPARADWARVFGAEAPVVVAAAPEPGLASRFKLIGVVAPKPADGVEGVALIAVDGKPPRAYRIGAPIDGELVLQGVQPRGAAIGPQGGAARLQLELPPLPPPSVGNLARGHVLPGRVGGAVPQPSAEPADEPADQPEPDPTPPQRNYD